MSENKQLEIRKNAYFYKFANYLIGGLTNYFYLCKIIGKFAN